MQRKLPHLFIPSKTAALVPGFVVEDLPLGRTAALVLEFEVKDLPLGRALMMMMMMSINGRRRLIGIFGSLNWPITLMELIFNYCGEFR